jgi:hypothetical protein
MKQAPRAAGLIVVALGLLSGSARADEAFEIFHDSFETPVVTGRPETNLPGWKRTLRNSVVSDTRAGLWNEDSGTMTTPAGDQAAWIWNDRQITTTNIAEKLTVGVTYTLTFNVAAESGLGGIHYLVELLAGTNVVGSASGGPLTSANFMSATVTVAAGLGHPGLGQTLAIRIGYVSGDWNYVLGVDNVRLVAQEAREWARTLFYGK